MKQNILNGLNRLLEHVDSISDFSKLPIPFVCIATDLETGEAKVLKEGYLPKAVQASGAFPTLLEPVEIDGQLLSWPFAAQQFGIGVIHQEPELAEQLSVTDNIFLGNEIGRNFFRSWLRLPNQDKMDSAASRLLTQLDAPFIPLHEKAGNLSREQKQLVSIAHVMARSNRLVLVDNPTPLLSLPYQQKLLQQQQQRS